MNTLATFVALAGLAATSASVATGCGCDPGSNSQRAAVAFTPSSVQSIRTPATCGPSPAFTSKDSFDVVLTGDTQVAPPSRRSRFTSRRRRRRIKPCLSR